MLNARADGVSVELKVVAGSKRTRLEALPAWLRVDVQAPAVEGKANAAVLSLLSDFFGCQARLLRGDTSSRKVVLLLGARIDDVRARLSSVASKA